MKIINKVVIIPDSFKGTMSTYEVADIIKNSVLNYYPDCETICIPIADGGEGSTDCFLNAIGGNKVTKVVANPFFEDIEVYYGLTENDKTAIIEMACCAGLPLAENRLNPAITTTYGVGQLIIDALDKGCKKIILGLGGSSTNDCGCGLASAVGVKFYDKDNKEFIPTGGTLKDICSINIKNIDSRIKNTEIIAMCDVKNPLYGESGASYVFARQKGADDNMLKELDNGLKHIADVISNDLKIDVHSLSGGGAAGGMGAGVYAFLGANLKSGIETVLDMVNFDNLIQNADLVFTGEGKFDIQSLGGKVIDGISNRAKKQNVPVIVISGDVNDEEIKSSYNSGVSAVFPINRVAKNFKDIKMYSKDYLKYTVDNIMRILSL